VKTRRQGDKETRRQGDKETRRQGEGLLLLVSLSPCLASHGASRLVGFTAGGPPAQDRRKFTPKPLAVPTTRPNTTITVSRVSASRRRRLLGGSGVYSGTAGAACGAANGLAAFGFRAANAGAGDGGG